MSFMLYEKTNRQYRKLEPIKIAGAEGVLAKYLQEFGKKDIPFTWKLTADEIIGRLKPGEDASQYEVVFDLSSDAQGIVTLYQVAAIQGSSDYEETDLVLNCHQLYEIKTSTLAEEKKSFFLEKEISGNSILEPLHLSGGTRTGTYRWGKPKMDIGAAIYSNAA